MNKIVLSMSLLLLLVGCGRTDGEDLIIQRNGDTLGGALLGCGPADCVFKGSSALQSLDRSMIEWIGLHTEAPPPSVADPTSDEVHLADRSVQQGGLLGINADVIVTQRGQYPRITARWIHLAPPQAKRNGDPIYQGDPGPSTPPTDEKPPPVSPPPPDSPPAASAARPPQPLNEAFTGCPKDKPLGGRVEENSDWNENGCRGSRHGMIRFPLVLSDAPSTPWPIILHSGFSAPEVTYELSTGGCSGTTVNGEEKCTAPSGRKYGKVTLGSVGPRGFTSDPHVDDYLHFYPEFPQIHAENMLTSINGTASTSLECIGPHSGGSTTWNFEFDGFFVGPDGPDCVQGIFSACIAATDCAHPATEAAQRECIMHADRHVVIPFSGQSTWTSPSASDPYYSGILKGKLRWEICCGCGTPPTPPEPSNDPCPSTLEADSNLETNRIMRQKKLKALDKAGKAYNEQLQEAGAHYDDYVKTIKACLIQSLVSKALISLLAPETEVAGVSQDVLEAMEFAEQNGLFPPMGLQQIADIVEKTVNGEDPTTVLAPEQLQNWNSTIGALAKVESLMSGSSAGEMEKSLEECQGAILVSPETKLSADKYVESIKAALDHLAEYNTLKNDIRDLDTAYPDLQYQSWAACVRRARCKHTPESDCDDRKPPGDWPDVPGRVF
jgi:hypothetical protein